MMDPSRRLLFHEFSWLNSFVMESRCNFSLVKWHKSLFTRPEWMTHTRTPRQYASLGVYVWKKIEVICKSCGPFSSPFASSLCKENEFVTVVKSLFLLSFILFPHLARFISLSFLAFSADLNERRTISPCLSQPDLSCVLTIAIDQNVLLRLITVSLKLIYSR